MRFLIPRGWLESCVCVVFCLLQCTLPAARAKNISIEIKYLKIEELEIYDVQKRFDWSHFAEMFSAGELT